MKEQVMGYSWLTCMVALFLLLGAISFSPIDTLILSLAIIAVVAFITSAICADFGEG